MEGQGAVEAFEWIAKRFTKKEIAIEKLEYLHEDLQKGLG